MWLRFGGLRTEEFIPAAILSFIAAFIFQSYGLYRINVFLSRSLSVIYLMKSLIGVSIVYLLGGFLTQFLWIAPSRLAFLYFVSALIIGFGVYRVLLLPAAFRWLSSASISRRRVLIVGANESGRQVALSLTYRKELCADVIGFVDDSLPMGSMVMTGFRVLGDTGSMAEIVELNLCDEVIIAGDHIEEGPLLSLITFAKKTKTTVRVVSDHFKTVCDNTVSESYDFQPTVTLTEGLYSPITAIYQRIADLIVSIIGLVIMCPFLIAAAIAIKATSHGPVLYKHERVGKNGKHFKMYKFRSMYVSGEGDEKRKEMMLRFMKESRIPDEKNTFGKVIDDSRVTPIGRFLRRTSFDEMPQLFNVLKGDMSLVGPRPVLPYEYEAMKEWHRERNRVLPGCTGFWQVYGRARTSFDDMVIMDIYMIENMSPWLYIQLILKTFPVLLFARGGK
jgi:exopolysaccharide biosynthesis polyprenyl glycosylphosphotransferase